MNAPISWSRCLMLQRPKVPSSSGRMRSGAARPMPSSLTVNTTAPSARTALETSTLFAQACLRTLVSNSPMHAQQDLGDGGWQTRMTLRDHEPALEPTARVEAAAELAEPHPEVRRRMRRPASSAGSRQDDLVELLERRAAQLVELVQLARLRNAAARDRGDPCSSAPRASASGPCSSRAASADASALAAACFLPIRSLADNSTSVARIRSRFRR